MWDREKSASLHQIELAGVAAFRSEIWWIWIGFFWCVKKFHGDHSWGLMWLDWKRNFDAGEKRKETLSCASGQVKLLSVSVSVYEVVCDI